MSSSALVQARDKIARLQVSTRRAREKAGEMMQTALHTGEAVGTAFAFGFLEGSLDDPKKFELAGVPLPLAVGVGAHAFAAFGVGRGMEDHFKAIGTGALAAHLNGLGRAYGAKRKALAGPKVSGDHNDNGMGVTAEDLEALAR